MGFHHVAIATRDLEATHRFYTEAMGFRLVRVEVAPSDEPGGWAKHLFYEVGDESGGLFAIWELHDPRVDEFDPAISTGLGLPVWVNHIAFAAPDLDAQAAARERWLDHGHDVMEIDHDWCVSVYTTDPNGILVEFSTLTRDFTAEDKAEAEQLLRDPAPSLRRDPKSVVITKAADWAARRSAA
jgi:catechol 2,3-dioxygenase-like lactoylglutathione lyase family enzyme